MKQETELKEQRFNIRLTSAAKERIEQAASLEGKTASSFILSSALAQAELTIRDHETMVLSRRDAEVLVDALMRPPRMSAKLAAALQEHERRVTPA